MASEEVYHQGQDRGVVEERENLMSKDRILMVRRQSFRNLAVGAVERPENRRVHVRRRDLATTCGTHSPAKLDW
jgi:hypothetical protein